MKFIFLFCTAMASQAAFLNVGDTVRIDFKYPLASSVFESRNVIVGPGTEATFLTGFPVFGIDLSQDFVRIDYRFANTWNSCCYAGLAITSDRIDDTVRAVLDQSTTMLGLHTNRVSVQGHTISIDWSGLSFQNGTLVAVALAPATPVASEVPEPQVLVPTALFLAFLLFLTFLRRHGALAQ